MTSEANQPRETFSSIARTSAGTAALSERLVAYLEGDLDLRAREEIEDLLSADPRARRELQLLDQAWHALDELPLSEAAPTLVHTTLEMIAFSAASDEAPRPSRGDRAWRFLGPLALVFAAAAGFGMTWLRLDPRGPLLADLPILENLDAYRQVEDVEFLRALRDSKLFLHDEPSDAQTP